MLIIRGIEVTQGIQYYRSDQHLTDAKDRGPDNSLRLVARKSAWVRVYVESDTPGSIAGVTGTLEVAYAVFNTRAGQEAPLTLSPQPPGCVIAPYQPDYVTTRSLTTETLNFVIPAERMFGPLILRVQVSAGTQSASTKVNISASLQQTLRVRGVMIGYSGPDPVTPGNMLTIAAPGVNDLQSTAAWAMRVMPVRATGVFQVATTLIRTTPLSGTATNGVCTAAWTTLNTAVAAAKVADGNKPGFLYYGLLAANFPNTSNNGGCESSGVSSGFNGDQITFAHEVGHPCGRDHAPCGTVGSSADANYPTYEPYSAASIGEFGLDITSGTVPTPTTGRDYMSYCGSVWISIYGHKALIDQPNLNPETVGIERPRWDNYRTYDRWWRYKGCWPGPLPDRSVLVQKVISVIGVRYPNGRVEVSSVMRTKVLDTEIRGVPTDLRVILQGANGKELASAVAIEQRGHGICGCSGGAPQGPVMFQAYLEDVGLGSCLVIQRGADTLWKRSPSKRKITVRPPTIRRTEDRGELELKWSVGTPVQDVWVRVSADEGITWTVAANGPARGSARLDPAQLPSGRLLVQAVANDGFRTIESNPVPFENEVKPPVATILSPTPEEDLEEGDTLCLWGSVAEQPGREDDDLRITWELDGERVGDGVQVFTRVPSVGEHRCNMLVHNTDGKPLSRASVAFRSDRGRERGVQSKL